MITSDDYLFMSRALRLAENGLNTTHPNPRVGCVMVRDGQIIGEAWHERAGKPHAELLALQASGGRVRGATVYVNLEPCCHQGRTPPCTEYLIDAGVSRVVAAMEDPNPQVSSGGIVKLREAGIDVDVGIMREQAVQLNRGFLQRMRRKRPWITVKIAASVDGRTAMATGESKWISSAESRADVQRLRARSSAIMTGIGTILTDNPALTVRQRGVDRQPLRVIMDSRLRMNKDALVLIPREEVLIFTSTNDQSMIQTFQKVGCEVVRLPPSTDGVDLHASMSELAERGVNELLVEAGRTLSGALVQSKLIDELIIYLAPQIMGGAARGMFDLPGLTRLKECARFVIHDVRRVGEDLRLVLRPV